MSTSTLGFLLLGLWLVMAGTMPLVGASFAHAATVLEILMVASGLLIIVGTRGSGRHWWT